MIMSCQSPKGSGGILSAHTHKLRDLNSPPVAPSLAAGVHLHWLIVPVSEKAS